MKRDNRKRNSQHEVKPLVVLKYGILGLNAELLAEEESRLSR